MKKSSAIFCFFMLLVLSACEATPPEGKYYFSLKDEGIDQEYLRYWSNLSLSDLQGTDLFSYVPYGEENVGEFTEYVRIDDVATAKLREFTDHIINYLYNLNRDSNAADMKNVSPYLSSELFSAIMECDVFKRRIEGISLNKVILRIENRPKTLLGNYVKAFTNDNGRKIYRVDLFFYIFTIANQQFYLDFPEFDSGDTGYSLYLYFDVTDIENPFLVQWLEKAKTKRAKTEVLFSPNGIEKMLLLNPAEAECSEYTPSKAGMVIADAAFEDTVSLDNEKAWEMYKFIYSFLMDIYSVNYKNMENFITIVEQYLSDNCRSEATYSSYYSLYPEEFERNKSVMYIKVIPARMNPGLFPHRKEHTVYRYLKGEKVFYAVKASFLAELHSDSSLRLGNEFLPGTWHYDSWIFVSENNGGYCVEAFKTGLSDTSFGTSEYCLGQRGDEELEELGYHRADIWNEEYNEP